MIPEMVEHIHYRKGPYYADEGDFSAAGAAHIHYKRELDRNLASFSAGSFDYRRALFAGNTAAGGGKLLGALELIGDNGPWDNPEKLRKLNAVLRFAKGTQSDGFTLTAMTYTSHWNSTDQIPARSVEGGAVGRFGAIDPTDGGRSSRYSLSGSWAQTAGSTSTRASAYMIRSQLDLFSNFTYFLNNPANGDQFEQVDRRTVSGGELSRTWQTNIGGRDAENVLGVRLRNDNIGEVGLHSTVARQRLATVRSDSVAQSSASAYFSSTVRLHEKLRTTAGLRSDFYRFNVTSDNPANSGRLTDSITSPKLGIVMGPWKETEFYFNLGHGFHSNDARGATITVDPATGAAVDRVTPLVRAKGTEAGLRTSPFKGFQTSLAVWRLGVASELLFVGDAGTTRPSRPSRRMGIEWAGYYKASKAMTFDFDMNWAKSRFTGDDPAGNFIPGSPGRTASAGFTYAGGSWSGGLRLRYFGGRPLVEDNSQRSKSSTLFNAKVGYRVSKQMKLGLDVHNLFNRKPNGIDYFYVSRLGGEPVAGVADIHSHPAEPRTLRISAMLEF
jgi:outer membrane receptor protein involved in Fe transport